MQMQTLICLFQLLILLSAHCPHIPSTFIHFDAISSIQYQLQNYFIQAPQTSSSSVVSSLLRINNGYLSQNGEQTVTGSIYPQNITMQRQTLNHTHDTITLRWYTDNTGNCKSKYTITLQENEGQCGFSILTIDYGINKFLPYYEIMGLCLRQDNTITGYLVRKYRADDSYKVEVGEPIKLEKKWKIETRYLQTTYLGGSSTSGIVSLTIGTQTGQFMYLAFQKPDPNPTLYTQQYLHQKFGNINAVVFGLGDNGKITAYLDANRKIIFYDGINSTIWNLPQNSQIPHSIYRLCWSSTLAIYTIRHLYFIDFKSPDSIQLIGSLQTQQGLQFRVVGKYLIGYKNKYETYFYRIHNSQLQQRYQKLTDEICFGCDDLHQGGFQEDLCTTNSFYLGNGKYSIVPFTVSIQQNQIIEFKWEQCQINTTFTKATIKQIILTTQQQSLPFIYDSVSIDSSLFIGNNLTYTLRYNQNSTTLSFWAQVSGLDLQIEKSCWIDSMSSLLIIGQTTDGISIYDCIWDGQCRIVNHLANQVFEGDCSLKEQKILPDKDHLIHSIFRMKSSSVYLQIKKSANRTATIQSELLLNDWLEQPQFLYQNYQDSNNFEISYITKTTVQNNAFCHYYIQSQAGQLSAHFRYPFEFEADSYHHCKTSSLILLYRQTDQYLSVKKIGLRHFKQYVIQDQIELEQYKDSTITCSQKGLGITNSNLMHFLDERLRVSQQWKISEFWDPKFMIETDQSILRYNSKTQIMEVYSKQYGILLNSNFDHKLSYSFGDVTCSSVKKSCYKYMDSLSVKIGRNTTTNVTIEAQNQYQIRSRVFGLRQRVEPIQIE